MSKEKKMLVNVDDDEEVVFPQSEKNTGLPGGLAVR